MKIEVYAANTHVTKKELDGKVVVAIDTLRAATTIVTALNNGCAQIIPVEDVEAAMDLCSKMRHNNAVLGGERNAQKLPGLDFGTSPLQYVEEAIRDKTLILSTTNGTATIARAVDAKALYIGALINATALVDELAKLHEDVTILCSGTHGKFSSDDIFTAGCFIHKLRSRVGKLELDDLGRMAEDFYARNSANVHGALSSATHYQRLVSLGLQADLDYCFSIDVCDVVPIYQDGRIVAR